MGLSVIRRSAHLRHHTEALGHIQLVQKEDLIFRRSSKRERYWGQNIYHIVKINRCNFRIEWEFLLPFLLFLSINLASTENLFSILLNANLTREILNVKQTKISIYVQQHLDGKLHSETEVFEQLFSLQ